MKRRSLALALTFFALLPRGIGAQANAVLGTAINGTYPYTTADVQFVGSRVFTQMMLPSFIKGQDLPSLQRAFPRYKDSLAETA